MADTSTDDEFDDFLDKVNEITSIISDLASRDKDTSIQALAKANRILGIPPGTSPNHAHSNDNGRVLCSKNVLKGEAWAAGSEDMGVGGGNAQESVLERFPVAGCVTRWNRTSINYEEMEPRERWMAETEADAKRRTEERRRRKNE
ncbi:uncharacterized protein LOC122258816 [Penaeus japonicus]|uniref:uncharacterized protein LOC122258816 n=1 Tax=Penaeus japonicus TaxID=27405 RepID=UPI001C70B3F3|nr:uncharacterized protein LOC122258816 [Penaeus japonicus]